jgi:hypothetical protein
MMRAIDQAELGHEINNACASVSANLTYMSLQSRNILQAGQSTDTKTNETFEEFAEVCQESLDAVQRVTGSIGKPKTEDRNEIVNIELDKLVTRLISCLNDYLPGRELHAQTHRVTVSGVYHILVSSLLKVLLSCIDARASSSSPQKKRIDIEIDATLKQTCVLKIVPHLAAEECDLIREATQELKPVVEDANIELKFNDEQSNPVIEYGLPITQEDG